MACIVLLSEVAVQHTWDTSSSEGVENQRCSVVGFCRMSNLERVFVTAPFFVS